MRVFLAGWLLLIVGLSFSPMTVKQHLTIGPMHNTGHLFAFLVATLLGFLTRKNILSGLTHCLGLIALAITLEGMEKLITSSNAFEWRDVGFDLLGIAAGLLLTIFLPKTRVTLRRMT
jgi:hypothetical protein